MSDTVAVGTENDREVNSKITREDIQYNTSGRSEEERQTFINELHAQLSRLDMNDQIAPWCTPEDWRALPNLRTPPSLNEHGLLGESISRRGPPHDPLSNPRSLRHRLSRFLSRRVTINTSHALESHCRQTPSSPILASNLSHENHGHTQIQSKRRLSSLVNALRVSRTAPEKRQTDHGRKSGIRKRLHDSISTIGQRAGKSNRAQSEPSIFTTTSAHSPSLLPTEPLATPVPHPIHPQVPNDVLDTRLAATAGNEQHRQHDTILSNPINERNAFARRFYNRLAVVGQLQPGKGRLRSIAGSSATSTQGRAAPLNTPETPSNGFVGANGHITGASIVVEGVEGVGGVATLAERPISAEYLPTAAVVNDQQCADGCLRSASSCQQDHSDRDARSETPG